MKFKVGDIVEIIGNESGHNFKNGEKIRLYKEYNGCSLPYYQRGGVGFHAERLNGQSILCDIVRASDIKLISTDKVLTITTSADKTTLTDGTHTTTIKRYYDAKPNEQNAVAIVIDKYYQELKDIEKAKNMPKVGDTVKVIDDGRTYANYDTWFVKNNIDIKYALKWKRGESTNNGEKYKIVAIYPHGGMSSYDKKSILALVEDERNCYIINIEGIEVVK